MRMPAVRPRTIPSLALLLCGGPLLAQQAARPPTAGVEAPVRSLLLDDDGTALAENPGALAFAGGLQLYYLHENGTGGRALQGNGVYLAGGLPWLVLGTALEWLRPAESCNPATPCDRRFSPAAGLRLGPLPPRATYHSHSRNESSALDHPTTRD